MDGREVDFLIGNWIEHTIERAMFLGFYVVYLEVS